MPIECPILRERVRIEKVYNKTSSQDIPSSEFSEFFSVSSGVFSIHKLGHAYEVEVHFSAGNKELQS